ncbi:MAG TPA: MATE family efflux transporter [Polyangiaceae bacterium]|nr:MATE family efflux transporter [Polyangiaceae bacterium]
METLELAPPSIALSGNRYKAILWLAMPTVVAMLSQSIVNEIDVIYFSHLQVPESSYAQGALVPSLIIFWAFGGSLGAISVGTQALVARRYAEGNRHAAGAVLANAVWFSIVAGAIFSAVGLALMPWLVNLIIERPEVQAVAVSYTRWRLLGVISMAATMSVKAFFDGIGKTYVHFVAAIVMNIVNVVLCWMFIFGHFGAPRMGAPGAGLAAFVSTWIGLAIIMLYAWAVRHDYRFVRWSNISRTTTWALLKLSVPAAIAIVVMMGGFALFAKIVGKLDVGEGKEAVFSAANTDIIETLKLTFTACMAFGTATATLIGQALGRKQPDEAQKWGWASVRLGLVIFGVVGLCEGVLFTHQLAHFLSNSGAVRHAMLFPLRIMGIATPVIAVAMILSEGLFGAGNTKYVAVAQALAIFGWLLPAAYVLGLKLDLGLRGIWIAAFVYSCIAAVAMVAKFAGGTWKNIKL